jgi:hypothetical protein
VEGVLKVFVRLFFCVIPDPPEVNVHFADAPSAVGVQERVKDGTIMTGIAPLDVDLPDRCVLEVVIAVLQI